MTTKSNSTAVELAFRRLTDIVSFGLKVRGEFLPFDETIFWANGRMIIEIDNEIKSVSALIKTLKNLQTVRWINHLVYKDGFGEIRSFKKFVATNYDNVNFS